jgi:outer membrane protein TolC
MRSLLLIIPVAGCALASQDRRYGALASDYDHGKPLVVVDGDPFAGAAHLERAALIREVLARNPDVAAARAAWRAALARYPEETALDDPMVSYSIAPLTIRDERVGQAVQIEEKLPTPGRRALAADVALAEAEAARGDVQTTRLDLALMASTTFDDYYVATRGLAINADHAKLVADFRKAVEIHFSTGHGSAQDAIEAEMEAAHIDHDRLALESQRDVAIAELNGLLHRAPDASIPPPPEALELPPDVDAPLATLETVADGVRPELATERARVRGADAAVELANKDFLPQVSVMARYDAMWDMPDMRWMLGVTVEIPLARARRHAAVERAEADAARARSEAAKTEDAVRVDVARARDRVLGSEHVLHVYDAELLPLGKARVDAARAGFVADQNNFDVVIGAERALRSVELDREQMIADAWRRRAELDRALGRLPGGGAP